LSRQGQIGRPNQALINGGQLVGIISATSFHFLQYSMRKLFFLPPGGWTVFDQPPMFKFAQFFEMKVTE
jgi:hypothetical protein